MTRGPAKPICAFGSAMLRSPSIAKLAVTPPVVGSVSTAMYGSRARSSRASAPEIFAICISERAPSIIRAPPEQHTITIGTRSSIARSIARVIFSPTTTPMLPPMKPYSIDATIARSPSIVPVAVMIASLSPVDSTPAFSRALYGLVSVKRSGSVETRSLSCSTQSPSKSMRSRSAAPIRKWWLHFGQTLRFAARSLL